jgi:hypothetical protein
LTDWKKFRETFPSSNEKQSSDQMANEIAYDLTIHPDDIPRLPTRLRKKVEENLYAYEILVPLH